MSMWIFDVLWCLAGGAAAIFVLVSVIGFIREGIAAKREQRQREVTWSILFVISMVIVACAAGAAVFLAVLSTLIMRGM